MYGHGEEFDELVEDRQTTRKYDPNEFLADCFAGALLMPKSAVLKGLSVRGYGLDTIVPQEIYRVSSWLGVGYGALLHHMHRALQMLTPQQFEALEKVRLPVIRKALLGVACGDQLIVADECWSGRPIDARVPDLIMLPADAQIEGNVLEIVRRDSKMCVARAIRPGIGRVLRHGHDWVQFVRVSKKDYVGLARFRHLEEVEDE
jgi:hypothetical protein